MRMAGGASGQGGGGGGGFQTLALAAVGILIGVASSWALARAISGLLFGVTATDPATFTGMLILLTAVAALAGYLPARPPSRINPMPPFRPHSRHFPIQAQPSSFLPLINPSP